MTTPKRRTMDNAARVTLKKYLKQSKADARLLARFDNVKYQEWDRFVAAFDALWRASFYLTEEASDILNAIQREIAKGVPLFEDLSNKSED